MDGMEKTSSGENEPFVVGQPGRLTPEEIAFLEKARAELEAKQANARRGKVNGRGWRPSGRYWGTCHECGNEDWVDRHGFCVCCGEDL